jgi:hypothetical protein
MWLKSGGFVDRVK